MMNTSEFRQLRHPRLQVAAGEHALGLPGGVWAASIHELHGREAGARGKGRHCKRPGQTHLHVPRQ